MARSNAIVIVPMYNEASAVGDVVRDLRNHFDSVVCVDDGSADDSVRVAREAGADVVRHPINLGQGAALQTGFDFALRYTSATHVVTFDADGQHRVSDALAMLEHAHSCNLDVVLGSRALGSTVHQPVARKILLGAALWFSRRTSHLPLTDTHNGLRVLSRTAISTLRLRHRGMTYATELEGQISASSLTWAEYPVTIEYSDYSRAKGQSNLNAFNIVFELASARLDGIRC